MSGVQVPPRQPYLSRRLYANPIVVVGFLVLFTFLGGKEAMVSTGHFIVHQPFHTVGFVLGYFLLGTVWSVVKWFFFVLKQRDIIIENRQRYPNSHDSIAPPQVTRHKGLILTWMVYWPFSMVWTLINDPVRRGFLWIYNRIANYLQGISNRIFRRLIEEQENQVNLKHFLKKQEANLRRQERLGQSN